MAVLLGLLRPVAGYSALWTIPRGHRESRRGRIQRQQHCGFQRGWNSQRDHRHRRLLRITTPSQREFDYRKAPKPSPGVIHKVMAMTGENDNFRATATDALAGLQAVMATIETGTVETTPARTWHLRGAIDALDALLNGTKFSNIE